MPLNLLLSGRFKEYFLTLLFLLPGYVIGLSFHEAAHAWMANKMGDPTAKNLGRLTLDPTKHINIFGVISFFIIGFGWASPVPVNPRNYNNYKKGNILVSIAGIITNLIIAFVFFGIVVLLIYGFNVTNTVILTILIFVVQMNIVMCVFNLIPIPPLDGHHLIKGWIARKSQKFYFYYMQYGNYLLLLLLLGGFLQNILFYAEYGIMWVFQQFYGLFL